MLFDHERLSLVRSWFLLSIILLSVLLVIMIPLSPVNVFPVSSNNVFPSDYPNHLAGIVQAKMALNEGQFPLRVMPLEYKGWGYPAYQFYSPSSYTIAGLIYQWVTPANPLTAYKLTLILILIIGGMYLYRLAFWFFQSRNAAILASVVYLLAPYCINDINFLGMLNESLAIGMIPIVVFYTLRRFYYPGDHGALVLAALSWYGLMTIHLLTFMYTSIFVAIFITFLSIQEKRWRPAFAVGIAYVFAYILAMWYLLPIALFAKYMVVSSRVGNLDPFNCLISGIEYLFSPLAHFNVVHHCHQNKIVTSVQPGMGWPILLAVGVCLYVGFQQRHRKRIFSSKWVMPLLCLFFIAFVFAWSPFNFWPWMPRFMLAIESTQRLLLQPYWIGALLVAWAVTWFFQDGFKPKYFFASIAFVFITSSPWLFVHFTRWMPVSMLLQNPILFFNGDDYLISFKKYPYINFVDSINLTTLYTPGPVASLKLQRIIKQGIIQEAYNPTLILRGALVSEKSATELPFYAHTNDHILYSKPMKSEKFNWNSALASSKERKFSLPIIPGGKITLSPISSQKTLIVGFLDPSKAISVEKITSSCHRKKAEIVCRINVPKEIRLLELPSLFYPGLLEVKVNGQEIPYQGVVHDNQLLTSIVPEEGKLNEVHIKFMGSYLGNQISYIGWISWIVAVILAIQQRFKFLGNKND